MVLDGLGIELQECRLVPSSIVDGLNFRRTRHSHRIRRDEDRNQQHQTGHGGEDMCPWKEEDAGEKGEHEDEKGADVVSVSHSQLVVQQGRRYGHHKEKDGEGSS